jgi:hypothetical protein|tara:strand:- start:160 stop:645 length:486 start_codon:yes stop_codon:yes gene_type:complete
VDPNEILRNAMQRHAGGDISGAVSQVEALLVEYPKFAPGFSYIGQTKVTRLRQFSDGVTYLNQAVEFGGDDPYILYTAGWCLEYIANALDRPKFKFQAVDGSAPEFYGRARELFLSSLELLRETPDDNLRGDVEDMLDVVASATGEPWDEELQEYVPPRIR